MKKTTINITRPKRANDQKRPTGKFGQEIPLEKPSLVCQVCGCVMVRMGFSHVCHNCGNSVADVH